MTRQHLTWRDMSEEYQLSALLTGDPSDMKTWGLPGVYGLWFYCMGDI